jgi:hypothetical protein
MLLFISMYKRHSVPDGILLGDDRPSNEALLMYVLMHKLN